MIAFDVGGASNDHSPSVKSVGITGQLTGSRADIIIADDIEVLNNSATQDARDKLAELVKEFDAILKPLPTSRIMYLGTPQTEMSIYNTLGERGYDTKIWCARIPSEAEIARYQGKLADYILELDGEVGTSTDPLRFSDADLEERLLSYGKAGFALQFMLDTGLSDADKYPLKLADLLVETVSRDKAHAEYSWSSRKELVYDDLPCVGLAGDRYYKPYWLSNSKIEYQGKVLAIDPSGRGSDEAAYVVGYHLNGYILVPEVGGMRDGYSDKTLSKLAYIAKAHGVNDIIVEGNFGDGMFIQLLKPHLQRIYPCNVEEVTNRTQKELRIIDTLEPVVMQHRLIIDPNVTREDYDKNEHELEYSLFYQMSRITRERGSIKHDDRLDCLSIMVAYWNALMDADAARAEQLRLEEEKDEILRQFIEEAGGNIHQNTNWCHW